MIILFYTIAFLFLASWAVAILGLQAGAWAHCLLLGTVAAMASRFNYNMIYPIKSNYKPHENKPGGETSEQSKKQR